MYIDTNGFIDNPLEKNAIKGNEYRFSDDWYNIGFDYRLDPRNQE